MELALAGFQKDDIDVEYKDNMLTGPTMKIKDDDVDGMSAEALQEMVSKVFTIADDVEVKESNLKMVC